MTPERARTPKRMRTPERTKTPDHGKTPMAQASHAPALDCMIVKQWVPPPSQVMTVRDCRATSASCGRKSERTAESDHSLRQSSRKKKVLAHSGSGDGPWEGSAAAKESDEGITPSPNMRKIFTRLQECRLLTPGIGSSANNGPTSQAKDGTA